MAQHHAPLVQNAAGIREAATQAGRDDGRRGHPRAASAGEATDYFGTAAHASAQSAATLHLGRHLDEVRPGLDGRIAEAAAQVVRLTGQTSDALARTSAADHEVHSFKRLPLPARREPWPGWLRIGLLAVMAVGTGAALAGALLELTSDAPYYVWGFCLATTLAVVGLGAFLAHLARSFEFNRLKANEFTAGVLPKLIFGVGAAFALLLTVALASIRGTAAEADAARQSRADDGVTVMLPDQAPHASDQTAPEGEDDEAPLPGVPASTFGILEGLLFMAAFGVEYINHLPWAEQRRRAEKALRVVEREQLTVSRQLAKSCARLMAVLDERADRDAAVLLAGGATVTHVGAEVSDYRRAVLAGHPNLSGDPFPDLPEVVDVDQAQWMSVQVTDRWGRDLQPTGLIRPEVPYDHLEIEQLVPTALARGLKVLAEVPQRAGFSSLTWDPAALVAGALAPDDSTSLPIGVRERGASDRPGVGHVGANGSGNGTSGGDGEGAQP